MNACYYRFTRPNVKLPESNLHTSRAGNALPARKRVTGPAGNNARIKSNVYERNFFVLSGNLQISRSKSYVQYFIAFVFIKVVMR